MPARTIGNLLLTRCRITISLMSFKLDHMMNRSRIASFLTPELTNNNQPHSFSLRINKRSPLCPTHPVIPYCEVTNEIGNLLLACCISKKSVTIRFYHFYWVWKVKIYLIYNVFCIVTGKI